jgi:hypothetical protein
MGNFEVSELFFKDSTWAFSFENVKNDYEWLESSTNCQLINDLNNEYTYENIFDLWVQYRIPEKVIGLPILASQYAKMLEEYTKYGCLMHFPEKEVYKMVRNVVKKSIMIIKISAMCGMFTYLPVDFIKNTLLPYYSEFIGKPVDSADSGYTFTYKANFYDLLKKYNVDKKDWLNGAVLENNMSEKYYDKYFWPRKKPYGDIKYLANNEHLIPCYNYIQQTMKFWSNIFPDKWCFSYPIVKSTINQDDTISIKATTVFAAFEIGFIDDLYTVISEQVGLSYIFYYLKLLKDDMTVDEMITWLNQIIHVYHLRGDICGLFIEGGINTLNKIENNT